ncbi:hypothetical protein ACF0H5_003598 [Mactra antiquata]
MFFRYITETRFGFKSTKNNHAKLPLNLGLVENLRCHNLDAYPVSCDDEGNPVPPLACSYGKDYANSHVLAVVDENGSIVLYNTNLTGEAAIMTDWCSHNNAVFDVEWTCNDKKLLTASGDQTIALWDVCEEQKLLTFKGHTSSVRSVKYRPYDDAVFASGSRDGHVRIWDSRCNIKDGKVSCVNVIKNAHCINVSSTSKKKRSRAGGPAQSNDCQQSVTCVLFQNDNLLTTSGAMDGCVKVWDMRKIKPDGNTSVYSFPYAGPSKRTHGFSSLVFDSYYTKLYANCTDDVIYCYDFISYNTEPVCTYKGHRNVSFYLKSVLSPDNEYLLSGSSDEFAYIWKVSKPHLSPVVLKGHRSEISAVAWCKTDLFKVVTTSDDCSIRVWRYDPTVPYRKQYNKTDLSSQIVGYAERTHSDIGTSMDERSTALPSPSTPTAVKRSATVSTFGPVIVQSPKQTKTSIKSSASPSIKMWLKRSASDSATLNTSSNVLSSLPDVKVGNKSSDKADVKIGSSVVPDSITDSKPVKTEISQQTGSPVTICSEPGPSAAKKIKTDSCNSKNTDVHTSGVRKSCKRKLVDDSPTKIKRCKLDECLNEENVLSNDKSTHDVSDTSERKMSPLKELSSELNKIPDKCDKNKNIFSSPTRGMLQQLSTSIYQSPTANLPNTVVDGPLRKVLHTPSKTKTLDWLTQMRNERKVKVSPVSEKYKPDENVTQSLSTVVKSPKIVDDSNTLSTLKSKVHGVRSIKLFFNKQSQS